MLITLTVACGAYLAGAGIQQLGTEQDNLYWLHFGVIVCLIMCCGAWIYSAF